MASSQQHTPLQSVFLHLLPGVFILVCILFFSRPIFPQLFGVDPELGPVVGYLLGLLVGLIPIQLGIILIAGKSETGKYSIRGTIQYTEKSPLQQYVLYVPLLILYFLVLFIGLAPLIQPYIIQAFFRWWPDQYNFQLILQDPTSIAGYGGIKALIIFYILLSGISGPLVEELYFRGYLLPRMENYAGKWAPLLSTVLFSLYHFFSPWENLIRIAAGYPVFYLVWKKKDLRFGILVHVIVNTIGGLGMLAIVS